MCAAFDRRTTWLLMTFGWGTPIRVARRSFSGAYYRTCKRTFSSDRCTVPSSRPTIVNMSNAAYWLVLAIIFLAALVSRVRCNCVAPNSVLEFRANFVDCSGHCCVDSLTPLYTPPQFYRLITLSVSQLYRRTDALSTKFTAAPEWDWFGPVAAKLDCFSFLPRNKESFGFNYQTAQERQKAQ